MLDIGWPEFAVILIVALLVIGPRDLPRALYTVGKWVRSARKVANEFQRHVDDMMREAELDDLKKGAPSHPQSQCEEAASGRHRSQGRIEVGTRSDRDWQAAGRAGGRAHHPPRRWPRRAKTPIRRMSEKSPIPAPSRRALPPLPIHRHPTPDHPKLERRGSARRPRARAQPKAEHRAQRKRPRTVHWRKTRARRRPRAPEKPLRRPAVAARRR